ncbi:MAG: long-chain fatty acid--CoA ligase [Deltaproteobacteria bacterium]|nr:long-chain fatty acid--CoA ligase [Deltaproteobacteria bacterium]
MNVTGSYDESTIIGCSLNRASRNRDKVYLNSRFDAGGRKTEAIHTMTWGEIDDTVRAMAVALESKGLEPFDRVAVFGPNTPRWIMATLGAFTMRCTFVPIYPSSKTEDVWWCLQDSGAKVVFSHGQEQLDKILAIRDRLDILEWIIVMDPDVAIDAPGVISFGILVEKGRAKKAEQENIERHLREIQPNDLVAIIYTSGTTGKPKGVMLTNKNFMSQLTVIEEYGFTPDDVWFCHLPLCHSLGFSVDFLNSGYQAGALFLVDSVDTQAIRKNLKDCRPTVMASVPRLWEKLYLQIGTMVRERPKFVQNIFHRAVAVGREHYQKKLDGEPIPFGLRVKARLADRVFKKILKKGGLDRLRICITGGGPIHPDLLVFFGAMGINLYQGFGLTETSPVTHASTPSANKIGWIGRPIPGTECKLAEDGELLVRGPQVMQGYWRNMEATIETFTEDGFLKTGDIAEIDDKGFVRITDRKKELIITSGGKNIAPQPLQNAFNTDPYIEQVYVVGDARKYLAALVVPNFEILEKWAARKGVRFENREELLENDAVKELLDDRVSRVNAGLSRYESIKYFAVLSREFSEEGGELTPTLKLKRRVIEEKYKEQIGSLYPDESGIEWRAEDGP